MSYVSNPIRRYRAPRATQLQAMGDNALDAFGLGFIGDALGMSSALNAVQAATDNICRATADAERAKGADDVRDLKDNWNPTGVYTKGQVKQIVEQAFVVNSAVSKALFESQKQTQIPSHAAVLNSASDIMGQVAKESLRFTDAIKEADQTGIDIIDAPGLKLWVLRMVNAGREARFAVSFVHCARPALALNLINGIIAAVNALIAIAKAIVGVAVALAEGAVKTAGDLLDALETVLKFAKFGIIIGGGYYLAMKLGMLPPPSEIGESIKKRLGR